MTNAAINSHSVWHGCVGRVLVLLLCAGIGQTADAQSHVPGLEPDWTWQTDAGIEWAEPVGPALAPAVLVALEDGRLQLIDLATGKPRFAEPIAAARGVRFAGGIKEQPPGPANLVYCFDRHAAYAIKVSEPAGLAWQYGQPPPKGSEFRDDPETLTGWSLADTTAAGLLLVNIDGRVVLLSHADGRPRWEIRLDRMPVARLHVCDTTAAVLWKSRGLVRVAFLALDGTTPTPIQRDLGEVWPVWSSLIPEGLLTASGHEATVWPVSGSERVSQLNVGAVSAQTTAVFTHAQSGPTSATSTPARRTRLVAGDGSHVLAYDLATAKELWRENAGPFRGFKVLSLTTHEDRVIVTTEMGVSVHDAATGRKLGDRPLLPTLPVAARWIGGSEILYVVHHVPAYAKVWPVLTRVELPLPGASVTARHDPSKIFDLQPASEIRQVLWSGQRMVVVEPNGLCAYTLP